MHERRCHYLVEDEDVFPNGLEPVGCPQPDNLILARRAENTAARKIVALTYARPVA